MNSNNQGVEQKKVVVPHEQLRLLIWLMEAKKTDDQKKIEQLQREATQVGIKM